MPLVVTVYSAGRTPSCILPMAAAVAYAGFPFQGEDFIEKDLDLAAHLIRHRDATFFMKVRGDSMEGAGINTGDLLVVDRAVDAVDGRVVVAAIDGELAVKRLRLRNGRAALVSDNPRYPPIEVAELSDLRIWGVVTSVIHAVQ